MHLFVLLATLAWTLTVQWIFHQQIRLSTRRPFAVSSRPTSTGSTLSPSLSGPFRIKSFEIETSRHSSETTTIQVREIDEDNKRLVPSFEKVGFQFIDVTKLPASINLNDYHQALEDVVLCDNRCKVNPVFKVIVSDLSRIHGLEFRMGTAHVQQRDSSKKNTHIHFDQTGEGHKVRSLPTNQLFKSPGYFRLWIPLQSIDNFVLGMGDTSALRDRSCAHLDAKRQSTCLDDFGKVIWYHRREMRRGDIILLANGRVPHFSVYRKEHGLHTLNRSALTIDLHVFYLGQSPLLF